MKTIKALVILLFVILFSCKKESGTDPVIETTLARSTAASICYAKATITEKGSYEIYDHGFVYSPNNVNFGIENGGYKVSLKSEPIKADTFSTNFSYANYGSQLYVRSYLTNARGTVYGAPLSFKPLLVSVFTLQPSSGKVGDKLTITGENFSSIIASNVVKFNNTPAKIIEASASRLVVEVPAGISSNVYDSYVTVNITVGQQTVSQSFTLQPVINGFSPASGTFGTIVTINGQNFTSGGLAVKCNDISASLNLISSSSVSFYVPNTITTEKFSIKLIKNGVENIVPGEFSMNPLTITSITPAKGYAGSSITINGTNFNPGYNVNKVKIGDVTTTIGYIYQNSFSMTVPVALTEGTKNVEITNGITNVVLPDAFNVIVPKITGMTPSTGYYGSEFTLSGENLSGGFYANLGNYGCELTLVNSSTIKIKVPSGPPSGANRFKITANSVVIFDSTFTVLSPVITSFSPGSGTPGTEVTINGSGFTNYSIVRFGTVNTTVFSTSPTQIKAAVPSNAGTGAMKITVVTGGCTSISDSDFTITN